MDEQFTEATRSSPSPVSVVCFCVRTFTLPACLVHLCVCVARAFRTDLFSLSVCLSACVFSCMSCCACFCLSIYTGVDDG